MAIQYFKANDDLEKKVASCFLPMLLLVDGVRDDFFEGAYNAYPLGDVLANTGDPIAQVMPIEVFRASFPEIHMLFTRPGTFEFYLTVFRKIWGEDVEVTFTVPAPGKLLIDIVALTAAYNLAMARRIVDNAYVRDEIIDQDGDNLIFLGTQGLQTQRQAENIIRELAPAGLWTEITLSIS